MPSCHSVQDSELAVQDLWAPSASGQHKVSNQLNAGPCGGMTDCVKKEQLELAIWRYLSGDNNSVWTGSDVVQSERPIFDDFFQHLWPNIDNNTADVVFQMVKRLWLIRIDQ
ncbi:hypothetical protein TNCV_5059181 [Trichonephila clavipes]|nr:hypothetical protein TNCV_5059181 [Trichonephila clavipes]